MIFDGSHDGPFNQHNNASTAEHLHPQENDIHGRHAMFDDSAAQTVVGQKERRAAAAKLMEWPRTDGFLPVDWVVYCSFSRLSRGCGACRNLIFLPLAGVTARKTASLTAMQQLASQRVMVQSDQLSRSTMTPRTK